MNKKEYIEVIYTFDPDLAKVGFSQALQRIPYDKVIIDFLNSESLFLLLLKRWYYKPFTIQKGLTNHLRSSSILELLSLNLGIITPKNFDISIQKISTCFVQNYKQKSDLRPDYLKSNRGKFYFDQNFNDITNIGYELNEANFNKSFDKIFKSLLTDIISYN